MLIMHLHCSVATVMTGEGHVLRGLNWNRNYFLDHRRIDDVMPLLSPSFSTATGKRK